MNRWARRGSVVLQGVLLVLGPVALRQWVTASAVMQYAPIRYLSLVVAAYVVALASTIVTVFVELVERRGTVVSRSFSVINGLLCAAFLMVPLSWRIPDTAFHLLQRLSTSLRTDVNQEDLRSVKAFWQGWDRQLDTLYLLLLVTAVVALFSALSRLRGSRRPGSLGGMQTSLAVEIPLVVGGVVGYGVRLLMGPPEPTGTQWLLLHAMLSPGAYVQTPWGLDAISAMFLQQEALFWMSFGAGVLVIQLYVSEVARLILRWTAEAVPPPGAAGAVAAAG